MSKNTAELDSILATLRDSPINSDGASADLLQKLYTYLMGVPMSSSGVCHWFCDQASTTTVGAASFLIRLYAYDGPNIDVWKKKFQACLSRCSSCVQKLEEIKATSRTTYFGAFPEDTLRVFYGTFENWELEIVIKELEEAGFQSNSPTLANKTLSDAPAPLVYRILTNWTIFSDSRIQEFIHNCVPTRCFSGWPNQTPPPGALILFVDDSSAVREWIRGQYPASDMSIILDDKFIGPYTNALEAISIQIQMHSIDPSRTPLSFSKDASVLWSGFSTVLRLLPPKRLDSSGLRHIVTGHLHDTGAHFIHVLRALLFLLKRLEKNFWAGEGPEFPRVVFDSVKDNPSFLSLLQEVHKSGQRLWIISWIPELLHTLQEQGIYGEVLAKVVDFLCEEMQHERFQDARPIFMNSAIQLLLSVFRKYQTDALFRHGSALLNTLDIHTGILIDVAYSRDYEHIKWENAHSAARTLVNLALTEDINQIVRTISRLCCSLQQAKQVKQNKNKGGIVDPIPLPSYRKQMWQKLYATIHTKDIVGVASIITIAAKASHLDNILKETFDSLLQLKSDSATSADKALDQVNNALHDLRTGFIDSISRFADYSVSTSALDVLRCPDVGEAVTMLLLSPISDFRVVAQTLVGLAFDVDIRLDCFRAMLVNLPDATLNGIFQFLSKFDGYVSEIPEACTLSKGLVRCFNDILEVLCSTPDGLLLRPEFLRPKDPEGPSSRTLEFWVRLSKAITVIFKHTVSWAVYYKSSEMVDWMRDAIILGRDMLKHWRTFENAANASVTTNAKSSKSLSGIGEKMIGCFQDMLPEIAKWLRLTDEELLYQAFAILQSLLEALNSVNVRPRAESLMKLSKYVAAARADRTKSKSRLDSASLSKLEEALAAFDPQFSSDDEIEVISHTLPGKVKTPSVASSKQKAEPRYLISDKKSEVGSRRPEPKLLSVAQPSSSKGTGLKYFTNHDQDKLEAEVNIPKFRQAPRNISDSSKSASIQKVTKKTDPKNEALAHTEPSDSGTSDSESEEEQGPGIGLSALGQLPKSPKIKKKEGERRQIKKMEIAMQKNAIQERLKNRNKANNQNAAQRLRPDTSALHRVILSWRYDHDGPSPPGQKLQLAYLPAVFTDYNHYRQVFEPLLLLECWSQIVRSKDESQDTFSCKIASRQYVSDWLDLELYIMGSVVDGWNLMETDIVLLRQPDQKKSVMAKTLSFTRKPNGIVAGVRCFIHGGTADPGLQISTIWRISKIFSLSTIHREYGALISLPHINLYDCVLSPRLSKPSDINANELQNTMKTYNLNKPQASAVLNTMTTDGFSLIQGPPGTGKTSTICALVARFVSQRPQPIQIPGKKEERAIKAKILLCAPSNAAIDEIAHRLKTGFCGPERGSRAINVVRIGASQTISNNVLEISLDKLVDKKLGVTSGPKSDAPAEIKVLNNEMASLKQLREEKLKELTNLQDNVARRATLEREAQVLSSRRQQLATQINNLRDQIKSDSRTLDALRRQARRDVLQEADVVCSTLSGAGHESLVDHEFEMVIIDEAAQAIELSSLIPLKYNCARCIMVGDPRQLPPTVMSQEATRHKYDQSLFVRLHNQCPDSVNLLSIQYRMHPDISRFPSQIFYQGRIEDGPCMEELTTRPWHQQHKFGTYRFFNISGMEQQASNSIKNVAECHVARALYRRLTAEFSKFDFTARIGIVSMYRAQLVELRQQFVQEFGSKILTEVDFNTVDGFQGQEKDVIILSCVRAGPGLQSVGFLSDIRRMNVAMTRAKSSLFILGNAPTLERSDDTWRQIITDARNRSLLVTVDSGFFSKASTPPPQHAEPSKKKIRPNPAPEVTTVVPVDLVTPKELKNMAGRRPSTSGTKSVLEPRTPSLSLAVAIEAGSSSAGTKRPAEAMDDASPPTVQVAHRNPARPPQLLPTTKRPKASTLFIPKKAKKK